MSARAWWVPVTLAPVLALFVVCLLEAIAWIGRPFPGFLVLDNAIVVSIGRTEWANVRYRRLPFARVIAVDGRPVSTGREVHARVREVGIGKTITFTFRQGTEIFRLAPRVRPFERDDFLELFAPFLGVGLVMVLAGAFVVARRPRAPETRALFLLCLAIGLPLFAAPDMYAPYRFALISFLGMCAVPPAAVQMALSFPQRRMILRRGPVLYVLLYLPFVVLAGVLLHVMREPALFLPLLYTVYFLMANGLLLNVGALVFGLIDGMQPRRPIALALAAVLGSSLIATSILATYPLLPRPISPAWAFGPLLLLPVLEGIAFLRFPRPVMPTP